MMRTSDLNMTTEQLEASSMWDFTDICSSISVPPAAEQKKYKMRECFNNVLHLGKKLRRAKPYIVKGRRERVKGKPENNPHYWIQIGDSVWDVLMGQLSDGTIQWSICLIPAEKYYKYFNMNTFERMPIAEYITTMSGEYDKNEDIFSSF